MRIELAVKRVFSNPRGYEKWRKLLSENSSDGGSIFPKTKSRHLMEH